MSADKKSFTEKLKSKKFLEYAFLFVLLIVVGVILVTNFIPSEKKTFSVDEYVESLEQKLSSILSEVENCGKVSVMITVNSGMTTVLAEEEEIKETSAGKETTVTPVIVNGETVVLKTVYPEVVGVLIIAEGANSISVKAKLLQAASSVLNVGTDKIEILTKK